MSTLEVVADIFDGYRLAEAWDEMFAAPGKPRAAYDALVSVLQPMDPGELRFRADQLARVFTDRGVTYDYAGEERPFPLDLIPRVIDAVEWDLVARGVRQRVRALEAFLADVYGPGHAFDDGVVPWRLVFTTEKFRREVAGIDPPNGVRVHVAGIDLVRDENGKFRVLEDNVRVPSGVSYVIENRLAMTRTFPALFAEQRVHEVDEYPSRLLGALRAAAPHGVVDPFVVVLTPGVHNAAYFEHTLLARLMGVELVEGRDLFCWRNRVYVHTTHGRRPVDVIYRRVDDDWLDPMHFRPDSAARLSRPDQRGAGRPRDHRQRHRQRGGRRQADLHLPARPDQVLPERGAAARERRVVPPRRPRRPRLGARLARPAGAEAGGRRGRRRHRHRPAGHGGAAGHPQGEGRREPARLGGAAAGGAVHLPGPRGGEAGAAAHRPAPLRGQRRQRRLGAPRRADPGGPPRG